MRILQILTLALLLIVSSGCGKAAAGRIEPVSNCKMNAPLELATADLGGRGVTLTNVAFFVDPVTQAVKKDPAGPPLEMKFFNITIDGVPAAELLGISVTPGTQAGFLRGFAPTIKPTKVDEEGFLHYYTLRRDISGRTRKTGDITQYDTRLAEWINFREVEGTILTSLKVKVQNNQLLSVEVNWPVAKALPWRQENPLLLPIIEKWDGRNETLCLKSAVVK